MSLTLTLDDFLALLSRHANAGKLASQVRRMRGIRDAMTSAERAEPGGLDAARRRRVARGAGVPVTEVSQLVRQFEFARALMRDGSRGAYRRARPGVVLGLVTGNPRHHDPSYVHALFAPTALQPVRVAAALLAFAALLTLVQRLVGHG